MIKKYRVVKMSVDDKIFWTGLWFFVAGVFIGMLSMVAPCVW
jgi:hypothetical protein